MTIVCNYKSKNQGFSKDENETIINLFNILNNIQNQTELLSKLEIFQIECELTDILKKVVDICNKKLFSNFTLELIMVDDNEDVY
jgi:hypothetical protein